MAFLLGFFVGLFAVIGLVGFLTYWLCSHFAVGKFIRGIVQVLMHKPIASEPLTPGEDGEAMQEVRRRR